MRNTLIANARQIAKDVRASEDHYDQALASHARLYAAMLDARRASGLPAATGRDTLNKTLEAMSHAARARDMIIETHAELAEMNLRELAFGDVFECPPPSGSLTHLHVVKNDSKAA